MDENAALEELERRLRAAVAADPAGMPWPEFMRRALYEPGLGYYERSARPVGRGGDFYTSVSVGPVFGELIAFQLSEWLGRLSKDGNADLEVVEAGAHDGRLAADILGWWDRARPTESRPWHYRIIEPSPARREWQRQRLAPWAGRVTWEADIRPFRGVLVANELLDAFPVERLVWSAAAHAWRRTRVQAGEGEGRFRFVLGPLPPALDPFLPDLPDPVLAVLPDGFTTEVSPAAEAWWAGAGGALGAGWMVAFDYGLTDLEWFTPQRARGTLRGYRDHRIVVDLPGRPGDVDLTAHVHFDRIRRAGETAGLSTTGLAEQRQFLTRIMSRTLAPGSGFGEWTPERVRQFQTLTHPEHLGRAFRVLIQGRGTA